MATSFGALCTDFYLNHKLALKMDLAGDRESVLHYFERVRKAMPSMSRFRRYEDELALESSRKDSEYKWLAMQRNSVRAGFVNPPSMEAAYKFHKLLVEQTPYYLSISPIEVDYLELLFGFDLECKGNHDAVVFEALYAGTPMARLLEDAPDTKILDVQPIFGGALSKSGDLQAYYEVKTRPRSRRGSGRRYGGEPISIFLTLRKYGPIHSVEELPAILTQLAERGEHLATERLVPDLLTPIARHITSSSA